MNYDKLSRSLRQYYKKGRNTEDFVTIFGAFRPLFCILCNLLEVVPLLSLTTFVLSVTSLFCILIISLSRVDFDILGFQ